MTAAAQSPADIANIALGRIGFKLRVGNLYDGSPGASNVLDIYAQTRDELQRGGEWPFTSRTTAATLVKQAPPGGFYGPATPWSATYPPLPWLFEYVYPTDCLKVRAVKPQEIIVPNFDPRPHIFAIANDSNQRVVLSNVANAIIVYTGQVTDPTQMPPDFVEAFAAALARRLAPELANLDVTKLEAQDEAAQAKMADAQQG